MLVATLIRPEVHDCLLAFDRFQISQLAVAEWAPPTAIENENRWLAAEDTFQVFRFAVKRLQNGIWGCDSHFERNGIGSLLGDVTLLCCEGQGCCRSEYG